MRYFLTGGTGFIGGELAKQLAAADHEVVALVRDPEKAQALFEVGAEIVKGDILEPETMREPMKGCDGVFHLAAWYKVGAPQTDAVEAHAMKLNVDGTRNVLELARDLKIPKIVYTSTLAVYSDTHGKFVDESYEHDGPFLNFYEKSKHRAHYEVAVPMQGVGLPLVIVQPGVVYGPGDTSQVGKTLRMFLKGKQKMIPKGCQHCWGHVEDTARAHILAMEKGRVGESYNICGPVWKLEDMFALASDLTGKPQPWLRMPPWALRLSAGFVAVFEDAFDFADDMRCETLRTNAGVTYIASNEKAKRELGFAPRPLEVGLRETLEWETARLNKKRR